MSRLPVASIVLSLGALASTCAWADTGDDIGALAGDHLRTCVTPYIQDSLGEGDALLTRLADSTAGSELMARLRDGAHDQWNAYFADAGEPLKDRVETALSLVGMAISHGDGRQKTIARAYSAFFLSSVTQGHCPAPEALARFVAQTPFWPVATAHPNPSVPPIVPNP